MSAKKKKVQCDRKFMNPVKGNTKVNITIMETQFDMSSILEELIEFVVLS